MYLFIWLLQVLIVAHRIWLSDHGLNQAPCTGSAESEPLDNEGSPHLFL